MRCFLRLTCDRAAGRARLHYPHQRAALAAIINVSPLQAGRSRAPSLIRSIGFIGVNGSLISISTKTFSRAAEKMFLGLSNYDIWELFMFVVDSLFLKVRYRFQLAQKCIQLLLWRETTDKRKKTNEKVKKKKKSQSLFYPPSMQAYRPLAPSNQAPCLGSATQWGPSHRGYRVRESVWNRFLWMVWPRRHGDRNHRTFGRFWRRTVMTSHRGCWYQWGKLNKNKAV